MRSVFCVPPSVKRGLRRSVSTFMRSSSWHESFIHLLGIFLVFQILLGCFVFTLVSSKTVLKNANIRVELRDTATDADIQSFYNAVTSLEYAHGVKYITREESFSRAQESSPELFTSLRRSHVYNLFKDTLAVHLRCLTDFVSFGEFIADDTWNPVVSPLFIAHVSSHTRHVHDVINMTRIAVAFFGASLLVTTMVLVSFLMMAVKTHSKTDPSLVSLPRSLGMNTDYVRMFLFIHIGMFLSGALLASMIVSVCMMIVATLYYPAFVSVGFIGDAFTMLYAIMWIMGPVIFIGEMIYVALISWGMSVYMTRSK
jgi:hypothetical protein